MAVAIVALTILGVGTAVIVKGRAWERRLRTKNESDEVATLPVTDDEPDDAEIDDDEPPWLADDDDDGLPGVFISYRRTDEPNFAGRLGDRLTQHFGASRVFMDVDSIELGLDFAEAINDYLADCQALIAVIGKAWIDAADPQGRRRLENPNDYVRLEIESALERRIRVIPVVVEGAPMPHAEELPPSIASLARRNGIEMSHASFGSDTAKLIATLDRIMKAEG
jgi:hypothetical protein